MKIIQPTDANREDICESIHLEDVESFEEVMQLYEVTAAEHPDRFLLMTLDDMGQADYTSMHATMSHYIDDTEGYDLSTLDTAAFEDGEHKGYLSTPSEFFIQKENFLKNAQKATFKNACDRGLDITDDEIQRLEDINKNPSSMLDDSVMLKIVPVQSAALAICAYPNGYFSCDLNPFENYALAKKLDEKYGYQLFGIGASIIGFRCKAPLDKQQAAALAIDLSKLYNCPNNSRATEFCEKVSTTSKYLFLKYVEYLEEF